MMPNQCIANPCSQGEDIHTQIIFTMLYCVTWNWNAEGNHTREILVRAKGTIS